ncbi:MAG: metallophosphoesterase family protein [Deltaproteobacteria bacterium]|nr:metallophosphoesterase family protein [Deltaproteobacteria bacterium]
MSTDAQKKDGFLVGVISDTHGHLRPEVAEAFAGVDLIIHAGDIGKNEVLEALRAIAPVHAVRGNMDGGWANGLPAAEVVEIGEVLIYVLHDAYLLNLDPAAAGFVAVINGHTHRAAVEKRKGVLFLNPGSASPHSSSGTVALLRIRGTSLVPQIVTL